MSDFTSTVGKWNVKPCPFVMGFKIDKCAKINGSEKMATATVKKSGDKFQAQWELKSREVEWSSF